MIRENRIIIVNLQAGDWSDATNYDLCLNSGKLGFEKCVDAILAQMEVMGIK